MLDDRSIEDRVRLIRPMEAYNISKKELEESHWENSHLHHNAEVAAVPEMTTSTIHIVTGSWGLNGPSEEP